MAKKVVLHLSLRKISRFKIPWFWLGVTGIFVLSLGLRFWGLKRFNTFVFDEVTYVKHAYSYLTNAPVNDPHPPLGKYLIAIAIWLDTHTHVTDTPKDITEVAQLSSLSFRWLNALVGSCVPPLVAVVAYQFSRRPGFALIGGLFAAVDGLLLVESRYALINIYIVFFGLLAQLFFLLALKDQPGWQRRLWLALAGLGFGAAVSVKWNGLWFLLGTYLLWAIAWIGRFVQSRRLRSLPPASLTPTDIPPDGFTQPDSGIPNTNPLSTPQPGSSRPDLETPLQNLTQINLFQVIYYLGLIPVNLYCLLWIPHQPFNPGASLWELHRQMIAFHAQMGPNAHPDCSPWYTWLGAVKHVSYWHQRFWEASTDPTRSQPTVEIVQDIHALGNPVLWWFSTGAVVLLMGLLIWRLRRGFTARSTVNASSGLRASHRIELWSIAYISIFYAANLLPWVGVTRCTFMYHYISASIFAFLALAWIVDRCLHSPDRFLRVVGVTVVFLVLWAFVFWSPIWLGTRLTMAEYQARLWLSSW